MGLLFMASMTENYVRGWSQCVLHGVFHVAYYTSFRIIFQNYGMPLFESMWIVYFLMAEFTFLISFWDTPREYQNCIEELYANKWIWFSSLASTIATICFVYGNSLIGFGDSMAILVTSCPLAAALGVCVLGEKINFLEVISICMCVIGVLFICRPTAIFRPIFPEMDLHQDFVESKWGYFWTSLAAFFTAINMLFTKLSAVSAHWTSFMYARCLLRVIICMLASAFFEQQVFDSADILVWPYFVACSVCCLIGTLFWMFSGKYIPVSHQSIIISFDKVWGYVIGVLVFDEELHILSIFGAIEIWIGILLMVYSKMDKMEEEKSPLLSIEDDYQQDDRWLEYNEEIMDVEQSKYGDISHDSLARTTVSISSSVAFIS